jgi:hypothetical protein
MKQYVSDIARAANEQSLGVTHGTESTGAGHSAKRGAGSQMATASQMLDAQSKSMSTLVDRFVS